MPKVNITNLTSFKTGDVMADGSMQATLVQAYGMKEGSASINIGEPESTDIFVEESDVAFASVSGKRESDITIELIGVEAQVLAPLLGATYTAANVTNGEVMTWPAAGVAVTKAIELKGLNSDGLPVTVSVPKAKIYSSTTGNVGRGDARGWQIKGKIQVPVNVAGVAQPWMKWEVGPHT